MKQRKYVKTFDDMQTQIKKFRVYSQWGTIDEGIEELGIYSAKDKKEAIEKAFKSKLQNKTEEEKMFYKTTTKAEEV